jgi:hypothetical protein
MPPGYAAEDGAALRFVGDELVEVVASRPEARAYKLERRGSQILETRLATRYLGAEAPATVDARVRRRRNPLSDVRRAAA